MSKIYTIIAIALLAFPAYAQQSPPPTDKTGN